MMELTVPGFTKVGGRALFTTKENNIILFIAVNFIRGTLFILITSVA